MLLFVEFFKHQTTLSKVLNTTKYKLSLVYSVDAFLENSLLKSQKNKK